MPHYSIYRLSVDNNIFGRPEVVDCDSDQEVIARAKARLDGLDVEVWNGPRIVIRLKSTDQPTSKAGYWPLSEAIGPF
ncbi:MAG TPA: hypothetical protein VK653_12920 [Xanthobacteraceae bacterium]|jgi:hypothetical protein|nr:hypothetical protein [Xanthobacteraceae bacterium]